VAVAVAVAVAAFSVSKTFQQPTWGDVII